MALLKALALAGLSVVESSQSVRARITVILEDFKSDCWFTAAYVVSIDLNVVSSAVDWQSQCLPVFDAYGSVAVVIENSIHVDPH